MSEKKEMPTTEMDGFAGKYLVFTIDESYALELSNVVEIVEYKNVTKVPETPPYIAGVTNLHGSVLPVLDMRARFHKPPADDLLRRCIVVIRFEGLRLGLVVDSVVDLVDIEACKISPPPQVGAAYSHVFIKAIGVYNDQMMLIIDANTLVSHADLSFLEGEDGAEEA